MVELGSVPGLGGLRPACFCTGSTESDSSGGGCRAAATGSPNSCVIELSGLGKTWPGPGEHSSWGHPHVILTSSFPRRYILEFPPP